ncbi:hypothetical protein [Borrelia sp. P9F1]|uniref:hypothetical protein n=1 Tax=Borrelia sp. P9F1 TaxID=3058374 RepID=UPI002649EF15|nr:hypothetical protein [Borrelia sp. P9F1]WKC58610.1 hypothetical protein QYZ68_05265 [Borrelia sp. P9F1]
MNLKTIIKRLDEILEVRLVRINERRARLNDSQESKKMWIKGYKDILANFLKDEIANLRADFESSNIQKSSRVSIASNLESLDEKLRFEMARMEANIVVVEDNLKACRSMKNKMQRAELIAARPILKREIVKRKVQQASIKVKIEKLDNLLKARYIETG